MDDLSQRDLSDVPDEDLTPEERRELQRRFNEFLEQLQERREYDSATGPRPRRIMRWDPAILSRQH
ncbi:MAG: hypothetical protein ACE5GS_17410 [Kiloniellaceae bacterium]